MSNAGDSGKPVPDVPPVTAGAPSEEHQQSAKNPEVSPPSKESSSPETSVIPEPEQPESSKAPANTSKKKAPAASETDPLIKKFQSAIDEQSKSTLNDASYSATDNPPPANDSAGTKVKPWESDDVFRWEFFLLQALTFLVALDGAAVSVAIPQLSADMNLSSDQSIWVGTFFFLSAAACQPTISTLAMLFGRSIIELVCIIVLLGGSISCSFGRSPFYLLFGRVLQGFGGGGCAGLSFSQITTAVPTRMSGNYLSQASSFLTLATIAGPSVGGFFGSAPEAWRYIFLLNIPFCVAGIWMVIVQISRTPDDYGAVTKTDLSEEEEREQSSPLLGLFKAFGNFFGPKTPSDVMSQKNPNKAAVQYQGLGFMEKIKRIDWLSISVYIPALCSFAIGISTGGTEFHWHSPRSYLPLIGGLVGLVLFTYSEKILQTIHHLEHKETALEKAQNSITAAGSSVAQELTEVQNKAQEQYQATLKGASKVALLVKNKIPGLPKPKNRFGAFIVNALDVNPYVYGDKPIVPLEVWDSWPKTLGFVEVCMHALVVCLCQFYLPLYYQSVDGFTAPLAGISVLPQAVAALPALLAGQRLVATTGKYKWLTFASWATLSLGFFVITVLDISSKMGQFLGYMIIHGIGSGIGRAVSHPVSVAHNKHSVIDATTQMALMKVIGNVLGSLAGGSIFANKVMEGLRYLKDTTDLVDVAPGIMDGTYSAIDIISRIHDKTIQSKVRAVFAEAMLFNWYFCGIICIIMAILSMFQPQSLLPIQNRIDLDEEAQVDVQADSHQEAESTPKKANDTIATDIYHWFKRN